MEIATRLASVPDAVKSPTFELAVVDVNLTTAPVAVPEVYPVKFPVKVSSLPFVKEAPAALLANAAAIFAAVAPLAEAVTVIPAKVKV